MTQARVTQLDIFRAADGIAAAGSVPTVDSVYAALGNKGSRTTLTKHLRTWREANPPEGQPDIPGLPEDARIAIGKVWRQLIKRAADKANHRFIQYRQQAHEQAESRIADAAKERDEALENARHERAVREEAETEQTRLEQNVHDLQADNSRLAMDISEADTASKKFRTRVARIHSRQKARIAELEQALAGARESADKEHATALKQEHESQKRYDADMAYRLKQIEDIRQQAAMLDGKLQQAHTEKSDARIEVKDAKMALARMQERLDQAQQNASEQVATLKTELDYQKAAASRANEAQAAANRREEYALQDMRKAHERLDKTVAQLTKAHKRIDALQHMLQRKGDGPGDN